VDDGGVAGARGRRMDECRHDGDPV
jgi:hypothetical protein